MAQSQTDDRYNAPIHQIKLADGEDRKIRVQDGHLFVCGTGCCCGRTEKDFPFLPLDELKLQWKDRGIRRRFHLTVAGCLGPCTLANVVLILFQGKSIWLHSISSTEDVTQLYDYAEAMMQADRYLEPPPELAAKHFQRYTVDTIDQTDCALTTKPTASAENPDREKTHAH